LESVTSSLADSYLAFGDASIGGLARSDSGSADPSNSQPSHTGEIRKQTGSFGVGEQYINTYKDIIYRMGRSLTNTSAVVGIPTPAPAPAPAPAPSRGCLEDRVAMLEDQHAALISANTEL
jgi:hypothetical protein